LLFLPWGFAWFIQLPPFLFMENFFGCLHLQWICCRFYRAKWKELNKECRKKLLQTAMVKTTLISKYNTNKSWDTGILIINSFVLMEKLLTGDNLCSSKVILERVRQCSI
jgi:hypothetical protein